MAVTDFELHNVSILLTLNKSVEYRGQVMAISDVLVKFLMGNDLLVNIDPYNEGGGIREDLVIKVSNVTPEGFELFKKVIPGWMQFIDKGGKIGNISRLEKGLAALRAKR